MVVARGQYLARHLSTLCDVIVRKKDFFWPLVRQHCIYSSCSSCARFKSGAHWRKARIWRRQPGGGAHRSAGHGGFLIRGGSLYSHPGQAIQSFNHQTKGYHVCINIRLWIPDLRRFAFSSRYEFVKLAKMAKMKEKVEKSYLFRCKKTQNRMR